MVNHRSAGQVRSKRSFTLVRGGKEFLISNPRTPWHGRCFVESCQDAQCPGVPCQTDAPERWPGIVCFVQLGWIASGGAGVVGLSWGVGASGWADGRAYTAACRAA